MVSKIKRTPRPLPFKCPIESILRRSYTFSDLVWRSTFIRSQHYWSVCLNRLYRWIWRSWRPSVRENCHPAQWPVQTHLLIISDYMSNASQTQQDWRHKPTLQRPYRRLREVGCQATSVASVWIHRPHNIIWHHGSRRSKAKARCWKDHWVSIFTTLTAINSLTCTFSFFYWKHTYSKDRVRLNFNVRRQISAAEKGAISRTRYLHN